MAAGRDGVPPSRLRTDEEVCCSRNLMLIVGKNPNFCRRKADNMTFIRPFS